MATEEEFGENLCNICGKQADVLAAYWRIGGGVFDLPSGYACFTCKPESFDSWMREMIGAN
jgi:hypothetical protein